MKKHYLLAGIALCMMSLPTLAAETDECIDCHNKISPGQVADFLASKHAETGEISCKTCHGDKHKSAEDSNLAQLPDEQVCAECHEQQFKQFSDGKHNFGWTSLNALPAAHMAPDELVEGGRGCGGCHNMGIKTEEQKKELREKGYRYQTNSCDECHTRHTFAKKEAQNPRACQQCHMGYDHPQWEMWSSSKHGARYFAKLEGSLPEGAAAPTCQHCHMPDGNHATQTAWGFLGVRLPLPEDKQAAADRVTILKALGVLDPETGEPTAILDAVKAVKMAKLDQASWEKERNKMIAICSGMPLRKLCPSAAGNGRRHSAEVRSADGRCHRNRRGALQGRHHQEARRIPAQLSIPSHLHAYQRRELERKPRRAFLHRSGTGADVHEAPHAHLSGVLPCQSGLRILVWLE